MQKMAAVATATAANQSGIPKFKEDLIEKAGRYLLCLGDISCSQCQLTKLVNRNIAGFL